MSSRKYFGWHLCMRKMQDIVHNFFFKICYAGKAEWAVIERAQNPFVCPGSVCALPLVHLRLCCLGALAPVLFKVFVVLYFLDI